MSRSSTIQQLVRGTTLGLALLVAATPVRAGRAARTGPAAEADGSVAPVFEEIELFWPDGSLRARYGIDARGRRSGTYLEYHPGGKLKLKAHYRADRLEGKYESFRENGRRELRAGYKAGLLHGKYEQRDEQGQLRLLGKYAAGLRDGKFSWYRDGELHSKQVWESGQLVLLEGLEPFPRPVAELRAALARIADPERVSTAPEGPKQPQALDADADLSAEERAAQDRQRDAALRRLMAYRELCGLAWSDMRLDHDYNHYTSMAARLLVRVGRLDHTPDNPGLPEDEYRAGYKGTSSSNLSRGSSLPGSIDSYMDDSDPGNIDRIGHRLWCLAPAMLRTGFGRRGSFSAMWSFDASRGKIPAHDVVAYPAPGYFPVEYFGERHAWSVQLYGGGYRVPRAAALDVRVYELDDEYRRAAEPLELDHLALVKNAVVFRPLGVSVVPGSRYWVEIGGVRSKKPGTLRYLVEFVAAGEAGERD